MEQESISSSCNSSSEERIGPRMRVKAECCHANPCSSESRPNINNEATTTTSRIAHGDSVARIHSRSGMLENCSSSKETTTESCSEEGENNHCSGASSSSNKDGAHPVTSTNTTSTNTSGSDDKGGSHGSSEEGGEYNNNTNCNNTNVEGNSASPAPSVQLQQHLSGSSNRYHHHHSYHHHHRRQVHARPASEGHESLPLPVMADAWPACAVEAHHDAGSSGGECETQAYADAAASSGTGDLLEPHKEPGFHKIKSTFKRLKRINNADPEESDSDKKKSPTSSAKCLKKQKRAYMETDAHHETLKKQSKKELLKEEKQRAACGDSSSEENGAGTNGSSSGSGTEGGYAGSASSNDVTPHTRTESSSSSSEDTPQPRRNHHHHKTNPNSNSNNVAYATRPLLTRKDESSLSSDIADFSSGATESKVAETMKALQDSASSSESITSNSGSDAEQEKQQHKQPRHGRKRRAPGLLPRSFALTTTEPRNRHGPRSHYSESVEDINAHRPPIMTVGSDVMAHILTFLEPPEILSVLTVPLSRDWTTTFTRQSELWRVLCLLEPFKAQVEEEDSSSDSSSMESFMDMPSELKLRFGKFRMLYTSFVRCMKYLARIKDDALNGRPPSIIDYGAGEVVTSTATHGISSNQNLQSFLARARGVVLQQHPSSNDEDEPLSDDEDQQQQVPPAAAAALAEPIGVSDDGSSSQEALPPVTRPRKSNKKRRHSEAKQDSNNREKPNSETKQPSRKKRKVKYGASKITQRLLLPATGGVATRSELPWSCAIYSIVNWMVGFADAEGIQTMCLKVLPFLLEDEQQRLTAQRAGLTDVVLRDMVMFPHSPQLHTAAFHTIVLLARPLGGQEGMLFHTSMVNSSGIFNATNGTAANGKNGIAVMLDSMRRFQTDEVLQAMSCWSLVNIALSPAQKDVLIKLGGIEVTTNAMMAHPHSAEVQFRALFALINLVIPCVNSANVAVAAAPVPAAAVDESSEREVLDEMVEQIVELVVHAMQTFCSSESILNRACLVLHNLSLTQDYHGALLWTPNCYQMLEWCLSNYRTDQVLQQSAAGTLHRLQMTLSSNEGLRARFNSALASQQQLSLEQAHREAIRLHEQHELQQERNRPSATGGDCL